MKLLLFLPLITAMQIVPLNGSFCYDAKCHEPCPRGKHDFREEGFGIMRVSQRSSIKWFIKGEEKFLGLTLSSKQESGAIELSRNFYIKSAVTVCSKCRHATGMVFMTLDQLQQLTTQHRELQPLLDTAMEEKGR